MRSEPRWVVSHTDNELPSRTNDSTDNELERMDESTTLFEQLRTDGPMTHSESERITLEHPDSFSPKLTALRTDRLELATASILIDSVLAPLMEFNTVSVDSS